MRRARHWRSNRGPTAPLREVEKQLSQLEIVSGAVLRHASAQRHSWGRGMVKSLVEQILIGRTDSSGNQILTVYSKIDQRYALYRTPERVVVQFADDDAVGDQQRAALAPLNPVRGEINGLIDGWRGSSDPDKQSKARLFEPPRRRRAGLRPGEGHRQRHRSAEQDQAGRGGRAHLGRAQRLHDRRRDHDGDAGRGRLADDDRVVADPSGVQEPVADGRLRRARRAVLDRAFDPRPLHPHRPAEPRQRRGCGAARADRRDLRGHPLQPAARRPRRVQVRRIEERFDLLRRPARRSSPARRPASTRSSSSPSSPASPSGWSARSWPRRA